MRALHSGRLNRASGCTFIGADGVEYRVAPADQVDSRSFYGGSLSFCVRMSLRAFQNSTGVQPNEAQADMINQQCGQQLYLDILNDEAGKWQRQLEESRERKAEPEGVQL